jgi:uncharacterized membrane protein YfcA
MVHGLNHTVNWRVVGRLAAGSIPTTNVTLALIAHFNMADANGGQVISSMLGVMLFLTALSLIFRDRLLRAMGGRVQQVSPRRTTLFTILTGIMLGFLVTISSVGAGALGVTILLLLYPRLPMAVIVGSDIAHAVPLTLVAGAGHWWLGAVDWALLTSLLAGSVPGIILGSWIAVRLPETVLRPILAATLCLVGGRLVF